MAWEPVLDGQLATEARHAVRDIAQAIANGQGTSRDPADLAVFWAYAASLFDDDESAAQLTVAIDTLLDAIAGGIDRPAMFGGLAGAGWALAHVVNDADDVLAMIDRLLLDAVSSDRLSHDLIDGLAGIGIYFLERDGELARRALERIVDHLADLAVTTSSGVAWPTTRARDAPLRFDCGVAHGTPGVIAMLGRAATFVPRATSLCRDAMRWLLARRPPADAAGRYPRWFETDGSAIQPARTAWCYGDPGIVAATWSASRRLGDSIEPARTLAVEITMRDLEHTRVIDTCLCHGTAGLAHLCNRYFQATGELVFRDAALAWFGRTLAMRRSDGVGGFAMAIGGDDAARSWVPSTDLLQGAAGVGLALLAGLGSVEPSWDRRLGCDVPTRGGS